MRVVTIKNPHHNGFPESDMAAAQAILVQYVEVFDAADAGTLCVRFTDGDRKGSIARLMMAESKERKPVIQWRHGRYPGDKNTHEITNPYIGGTLVWDGRKNRVKFFGTIGDDREVEFILDYDGPTVWEKFDAKAAKEELLKNPDQKDINGNVLAVGDPVLYINARYGSRMVLTEGKIVEFNASVNSAGHTIATIIESASGEQSSLQYPEDMVYKL